MDIIFWEVGKYFFLFKNIFFKQISNFKKNKNKKSKLSTAMPLANQTLPRKGAQRHRRALS